MNKSPEEVKVENIVLRRYMKLQSDFFFIQIGANDGIHDDPIYLHLRMFGWKGILVEPVPYLFQRLQDNYKTCQGLIFENVAIAATDGVKPFYRIKENKDPEIPDWYDLLGTFNKEILLQHSDYMPQMEKYLIAEDIPCLSFRSLLKKHQVKTIDLLLIDTEGYDYEIIRTIPFETTKPNMILYEHRHLNTADQTDCRHLLESHGYSFIQMEFDSFASVLDPTADSGQTL